MFWHKKKKPELEPSPRSCTAREFVNAFQDLLLLVKERPLTEEEYQSIADTVRYGANAVYSVDVIRKVVGGGPDG